jgi:hypothetical protein
MNGFGTTGKSTSQSTSSTMMTGGRTVLVQPLIDEPLWIVFESIRSPEVFAAVHHDGTIRNPVKSRVSLTDMRLGNFSQRTSYWAECTEASPRAWSRARQRQ